MPNLWDIPPKPEHGDALAETTFVAVGRALSVWERLDLELAVLYATLLGIRPVDAVKRPDYRDQNAFAGRLGVTRQAFDAYRQTHHDQAVEGAADALFADADGLSRRRNDIAHGIVVHRWDDRRAEEFILLPAMYRDKRFKDAGEPEFVYSSVEIDAFRDVFERTIQRCVRLHWIIGRRIDPRPELGPLGIT